MNDVDAVNIGNLVEIGAGFPLRGSVDALPVGEVRIIQMRNVNAENGVDWDSAAKITLPTKREPVWLRSGDIIFAARGTKNYAVALLNVPGRAVCSPHFFVLRSKGMCDPEFLAWQINQKPAQDYFKRTATGSNILNIRREALEKLRIMLPPLVQQKTIIRYFQTAMAEKRVLEALIKNRKQEIEAIAQNLMHKILENHANG
jgi:restriction endonuclease S subunit